MKDISFIVPCYNSESYMEHCIESLLIGKDQIEIIIIDDGSKDKTGKIADKYLKKYPNIIKVRHQENGGHGEGINQGIKLAEGRYVKVIDSDDWADEKAYKTLLKKVKKIDSDLIVMNYTYTYTDGRPNQTIDFSNVFPNDRECTWDETKRFKMTQYLSLHSLMFKKEVLDKAKIKLPKHTFYEDNLFIYQGLRFVNTIYYMKLDFYHYFIGREDQSVQEPQLIKRSSHQRLVTTLACNQYDLDEVENVKLRKLLRRVCSFLIAIGVVFTRLAYTDEAEKDYKKMLYDIKEGNPKLYDSIMKKPSLGRYAAMRGKIGRFIVVHGYRFAHNLVKFN